MPKSHPVKQPLSPLSLSLLTKNAKLKRQRTYLAHVAPQSATMVSEVGVEVAMRSGGLVAVRGSSSSRGHRPTEREQMRGEIKYNGFVRARGCQEMVLLGPGGARKWVC